MNIAIADTDAAIEKVCPVMLELRPHLKAEQFVERVRRQQKIGFHLAYLEDQGQVRAAAGYRCGESLASGRYLYVDDLVTREVDRSKGYGEALFKWLLNQAREKNCHTFNLDSGVQRYAAHRFYLTMRMDILAHHFLIRLQPPA